jgi:hypothetical protein
MAKGVPKSPFRSASGASLAVQKRALLVAHPWLTVSVQGIRLTAKGRCRPTPLTESYLVKVEYVLGFNPVADVLNPVPKRRDPSVQVIHTNDGMDSRPCLFLPKTREWHGGLLLADTVIPWLMEWLVFYEAWVASGEWAGGGVLPAGYPGAY